MSRTTKDLLKLVEKRAGDANSWVTAQTLISAGADIRAPLNNGSMVHFATAEEKRQRQLIGWKADNCLELVKVLEKRASDLLVEQVFSANGGDANEMRRLIQLRADTYQLERFGPLGLLGELLKQDKIAIRPEVVLSLIEGDPYRRAGVTAENEQGQTCLSLSRDNPKCTKEAVECLRNELDKTLNKAPWFRPPIAVNDIVCWVRRGANTEAVDELGNTVLANAVLANNLELVRALVSCGCDITHANAEKLTPIDIAKKATPRNQPLIAALEVQTVNTELKKLIETKKASLMPDEVNALLTKGANINAPIANNNSLLHVLINSKGTPEMVTAFINEFNADINIMNTSGHRPIETCILVDDEPFTVLKAFLRLPKVPNSMFFNAKLKKSLFQFALDQNRLGTSKVIQHEINQRLWACVAQANSKKKHNQTIKDEVTEMISYGAQIDNKHTDKEHEEWTVLHLAAGSTAKGFIQFLIEDMKASYLLPNRQGDYPIAVAAEHGQLAIVEYLRILPGSNVNVTNKEMQTPLHLATKNHHLLVVRFLVLWGANHQAQNDAKQTPLDIARKNTAKTKEDEMNDKKLVSFLEQLNCPPVEKEGKKSEATTNKPSVELDTCELVVPVPVKSIPAGNTDPEGLGNKSLGMFSGSPNTNLHAAAKDGAVHEANEALGQGADVCFVKGNRNSYQVAQGSVTEYHAKLQLGNVGFENRERLQVMMLGCQQIANTIRQVAHKKLVEAVERSDPSLVKAYHQAGAPITEDFLYYACSTSDNVEIVDYLLLQSQDVYQSIFNYTRPDSPYRTAKKKKFNNVASYLKYLLSVDCTKAVKENNLPFVQRLVNAGASVDMPDTNNLQEAFKHGDPALIDLLCTHGAKMPAEWLNSPTITLPPDVAAKMTPEVVLRIDRCLVNRRLRYVAACGNLAEVVRCQRLGADINSMNCHGSTAVLCTMQYGNFFTVVHTLVSSGASILHSNDNEPMSLIDLAKSRHYDQLTNYLAKEFNSQFITSILNNDRESAERFSQLGVEFNHEDEQKRTALHYAVQYHGIDLVKWLCECGSSPMLADINGDYPIILATEKGDYAVVELFVSNYPATRKHTNKAGLTALQIAQKLKYGRIAQLIETGKAVAESGEEAQQPQGPKHTPEELLQAAKKGQVKTIQEFRADRYDSVEVKRKLCHELIQVATKAKQLEIVDILQPYYANELRSAIPSDIQVGGNVTLNERYKQILLGFLTGLSSVIAGCTVVLDPSDPNTYVELFSGLTSNLAKHSKELQQVSSEHDATKLCNQDLAEVSQQLDRITDELQKLTGTKEELLVRMREAEENLAKNSDLSALQRKQLFDEKEANKRQLAVYECSMFLFQRQQEATLNRQNTLKFMKNDPNLFLFYRTIENRLQALFHSVLAAQGGQLAREMSTKYATASKVTNAVPAIAVIPFADTILGPIKAVISGILSKLDEKEQKKEWQNISTMGSIEELERLASDTAGMMTLYYREQIQSIDTNGKIKGSNIFNDKIKWIKDVFVDVRPESSEEMAVVIVAEYITAWIIDALKAGKKEIKPNEPLSQQLWLGVAKKDPLGQGTMDKLSDVFGVGAGKQKIPLTMKKTNSKKEEKAVSVELRYLIACPSVVGENGKLYQYPVPEDSTEEDLQDLNVFGYVYIAPFSSDEKTLDAIVSGRKLQPAKTNATNDVLTKLDEIRQLAQVYLPQGMEHASQSFITKETANHVAQVLREQKTFVDAKTVRAELDQARKTVDLSVEVLKEEIQKKVAYYQTSIDAAHEQIKEESTKNLTGIKKDNEERYSQALKKLLERHQESEARLEKKIDDRLTDIQKEMQTKMKEIFSMVEEAKNQAARALEQATASAQASERAAQEADKSAKHSQNLIDTTEQRRLELQTTANECKEQVTKTTAEQKEMFERNVTEIRTKIQKDFEQTKQAATESAASAKESSKTAQEATSAGRETVKLTKEELEVQKSESKKLLAEAKETRLESERSAQLSKEAEKSATRGAEETTKALEKVNSMYEKMRDALERVEKLAKKIDSK